MEWPASAGIIVSCNFGTPRPCCLVCVLIPLKQKKNSSADDGPEREDDGDDIAADKVNRGNCVGERVREHDIIKLYSH